MKMFSAPCFTFLLVLSLRAFLPAQLSSCLSFHHLVTINNDLHQIFYLIQTLCLHSRGSILLHKTLIVNHYLHSDYFQQEPYLFEGSKMCDDIVILLLGHARGNK